MQLTKQGTISHRADWDGRGQENPLLEEKKKFMQNSAVIPVFLHFTDFGDFFVCVSAFPKGHLLRCYNISPHYFPISTSRWQCWESGRKVNKKGSVKKTVGPLGVIDTDGWDLQVGR